MNGWWNKALINQNCDRNRNKIFKKFDYSNEYETFKSNFMYITDELYGYIQINHKNKILKSDESKKIGIDQKLELSLKNYILVRDIFRKSKRRFVKFERVMQAFNELKNMLDLLNIDKFYYFNYYCSLEKYLYHIKNYHINEYNACEYKFCENNSIYFLRWQNNYKALEKYKAERGHCDVSQGDKENKVLGVWVRTQRTAYKNGKLGQDKIKLLEELGFVWDVFDQKWHKQYQELQAYKTEFGHCNVSTIDKDNKFLGMWVVHQRTAYKNGKLKQARINLLERLGFVWGTQEKQWQDNYKSLQAYKAENGNCNVSQVDKEHKFLGWWVVNQRAEYKNGDLDSEKIKLLDELGFVWNPNYQKWKESYHKLLDYYVKNGHVNVPRSFCSLNMWITKQRKAYKNGKLEQDKINLLEGVGFVWGKTRDQKWKEKYMELKAYKAEQGHCDVSTHDKENKVLRKWVNTQRVAYKNNKLKNDRFNMLKQIGFRFSI